MNESKRIYLLLILIVAFCIWGKLTNAQSINEVKQFMIDSTTIEHQDIVLRQSIEESGHFKCTGCSRDVNNLFGFTWKKKYIQFNTWQESVMYYDRWQKRHYKGGDYYEFLKSVGYATNPKYISNLKRIKL